MGYNESRSGRIRHTGDIHPYSFGARPSETDRVTIQVTGGGSGIRPCFRLFGPDGNPIRQEVCGADTVAQFVYVSGTRLTDPGTYIIFVYEQDYDRLYDYTLTLTCVGRCDQDPLTDLSVTKTDSPDPVTVGGELRYTITATNNGPYNATDVVVIDTLPTELTFISATSTQGSCAEEAGIVACVLGTLAAGQTATVTIDARPTVAGVISNTAVVTAREPDPNPDNNVATETTTVRGLIVIDVTLTGCNPCREGDTFSARISVENRTARAVEMKLGYLQPDGIMSSIGNPHREVPGGASFVETFTETIRAGLPTGTWQICGRLVGLQLGETQSVSCPSFTIEP